MRITGAVVKVLDSFLKYYYKSVKKKFTGKIDMNRQLRDLKTQMHTNKNIYP